MVAGGIYTRGKWQPACRTLVGGHLGLHGLGVVPSGGGFSGLVCHMCHTPRSCPGSLLSLASHLSGQPLLSAGGQEAAWVAVR